MDRMLKYLVIDVDGTMTDGGVYYDENGNELKKFNTKDAAGFFAAHKAGIEILVLTGRECKATERRMKELKVDFLHQNIKNKMEFLKDFIGSRNIAKEEIGYIGDDLNDLPPMTLTGFVGCPADSCAEVREKADYVSPLKGGEGAVRDIVEFILRKSGEWEEAVDEVYGIGV